MKRVVVFLVLAMVVIGSSAAQSAAADAQRIVGSWTIIDSHPHNAGSIWANGTVWVFNANGTGIRGGEVFSFGISADGRIGINQTTSGWNLFIAPNGSRMIFGNVVFQRN